MDEVRHVLRRSLNNSRDGQTYPPYTPILGRGGSQGGGGHTCIIMGITMEETILIIVVAHVLVSAAHEAKLTPCSDGGALHLGIFS